MGLNTFWKGLWRPKEGRVAGKYTNLSLSKEAISRGEYKSHLGGGSESWDTRGLFQLHLLRSRGLNPSSTLLDIGCGPLRAGIHFIRYLDAGNYFGFDYNVSFIAAGRKLIDDNELSVKKPSLLALSDFNLMEIQRTFDFAIAFSVLNHSNEQQRRLFFREIGPRLNPGAKLFISHARWLKESDLRPAGLAIKHRFEPAELDLAEFGWPVADQRSVCPIYEFMKFPA